MQLTILLCTGPPITMKDHLGQTVNRIEVEKACHIIIEPSVTHPTNFTSCSLMKLGFRGSEQFSKI